METWVWAVVALGLLFEYVNGFHDAANAIATSVLTRALTVRSAVILCAILNFLGAAVSKKAVAATMEAGIVDPANVTAHVVVAALLGAIIWDVITWRFGLPTSSTHAIVGGVIGAAVGSRGWQVVKLAGTKKVFAGLLLSPVVGLTGAFVLMMVFLWVFGRQPPAKVNRRFRIVQVFSASLMAFSHGQNDGQKCMGVITMALVAGAIIAGQKGTAIPPPLWVMISCATAMGLGSGMGGWKIIKTLGRGVMELQPIHGCVAELSAATIILAASHVGAPISTTHTVSATIMGVGVSRSLRAVRWKVVGNIVLAWILTMPASCLLSYLSVIVLRAFS